MALRPSHIAAAQALWPKAGTEIPWEAVGNVLGRVARQRFVAVGNEARHEMISERRLLKLREGKLTSFAIGPPEVPAPQGISLYVLPLARMEHLDKWLECPISNPASILFADSHYLDVANSQRVSYCLGLLREVTSLAAPEFSLIDNYPKRIYARRNEDPRLFVWGVTVYGPEMVKQIGRDRLLSAPAWKVGELEYGGVWVQLAENPFQYDLKQARAVEKHLRLAEVFSAEAPASVHRAEEEREVLDATRPSRDEEEYRFPQSVVLVAGVEATDVGIVEGVSRFEAVNGEAVLGLEVARAGFEEDPEGMVGPVDVDGLARAVEKVRGLVEAAGFTAEPGVWVAFQDERAMREGA